LLNAILAGI